MAPPTIFIPKDDQRLPDSYGMSIYYLDGTHEEFEVASHRIIDQTQILNPAGAWQDDQSKTRFDYTATNAVFIELALKDDLFVWLPFSGIKKIGFNKDWSKIVAIRNEKREKKKEAFG